jgi:hypothetical protein
MADNAAASAQLREWIERLRGLPAALVTASAPEVRDALDREIKANVAAAKGPDGTAWAPKQDGERALPNAAERVKVEVEGTVILATLRGNEVKHHKGTARGGEKRQILPTRQIPAPVTQAIKAVFGKNFARLARG